MSIVLCALLLAGLGYSRSTFRKLESDAGFKSVAASQVPRLLEIHLLLSRLVAGDAVASDLQQKSRIFAAANHALRLGGEFENEEGSVESLHAAPPELSVDLEAADSRWSAYSKAVASVRSCLERRATTMRTSSDQLAPLLAGISSLERFYSADEDLYEYHLEEIESVRAGITSSRDAMYKLLALPRGEEFEQTRLMLEVSVDKVLDLLLALRDGSEELELEPTKDARTLPLFESTIEAARQLVESSGQFTRSKVELEDLMAGLSLQVLELRDLQQSLLDRTELAGMRSLDSMQVAQSIIFWLTVAVALCSGILIRSQIVRPILRTSELLREIAHGDGDLTARLRVTADDEIGELAFWFDSFVDRIQRLVQHLAGTVEQVGASSRDVDSVASEVGVSIEGAAAQSQELQVTVQRMGQSLSGTKDRILAGSLDVGRSVEEAVGAAGRAGEALAELVRSTQNIDGVLGAINVIASKTRLLSINASTEAARAGTAGLGFGVVAEEVKALAEQTSKQTTEVERILCEVRAASSRSIEMLSEVQEVISKVTDGQKVTTEDIVAELQGIGSSSESVLTAVLELSSRMQSTSRAASSNAQCADSLRSISLALDEMVAQFKY